jgi:trehalose synthase
MPPEPSTIPTGSASIEPFRALLESGAWDVFSRTLRDTAAQLKNVTIWNINSTPRGGGVAEMLTWQIPYERNVGMDVRWLVIQGGTPFFTFTKRLHALLHGVAADGSMINDAERTEYEQTLGRNAEALAREIRPGDVVILHDPQTAALVPYFVRHGCRVIWRCHIGVDQPNEVAKGAWRFLLPHVAAAHATVFSRRAYVWEGLDQHRVEVIPPAIDAFAHKNQELDDQTVAAILRTTGILTDGAAGQAQLKVGALNVERTTDLFPGTRLPEDARLTVQVSRWDRLKDPLGVMEGFAQFVAPRFDSHLILAGPGASTVADDPEEAGVLREVEDRWHHLPPAARDRVHLARLPMDDPQENAIIVNALQRRAHVVVQKSLGEGFGLTVAEAMWKGRPVVASRVGGIQDQIERDKSGLLIDDPRDLAAFGAAVVSLFSDPALAERLGAEAKRRVQRQFLAPRLLMQQASLIGRLVQNVK